MTGFEPVGLSSGTGPHSLHNLWS